MTSITALNARLDASEVRLDRIEGLLVTLVERTAPAKAEVFIPAPPKGAAFKADREAKFEAQRASARKTAKRSAPASARLTRKAWNDAFVAKAKFSGLRDPRGVSLYRVALNRWDEVQAMRTALVSPDAAIKALMQGKRWA